MLHQAIEIADDVDELPLVIDLDGTLLRSDVLVESGLQFIREQPERVFSLFRWLTAGKAALKHRLAAEVDLDVTSLPYDRAILDFILSERLRGRRIVLATATNIGIAARVADHLGLFDEVLASDADRNLSGAVKRAALVDAYGEAGFDYAGNAAEDVAVWRSARHAYVANASSATRRHAHRVAHVAGEFAPRQASVADWRRAVRLHQWAKNLLVFVPLLGAHRLGDSAALLHACVAFLCFGCCASAAYILNDLLDLKDDRNHPTKRFRPFAAGHIPVTTGLVAAPLLLALSFWVAAWLLPVAFMAGLACYCAATFAYSVVLKKLMIVDVMTLAGLYTVRIVAGGLAVAAALSFWLLALSVFLFFSLAMTKRFAELRRLASSEAEAKVGGRGYIANDLPMLATLGATSGFAAVMVLALYVNDSRTAELYRRPEMIWLACPLLLAWVSRAWMLAGRGQMNEDPVIFALRDRPSQIMGVLCALVFVAAA
jgi:4-hydroxybenzoate polyprenyltransferase/phosphoserine phosphatase